MSLQRRFNDIRTSQNAVTRTKTSVPMRAPFFAQVVNVYADRMTCDIDTVDLYRIFNVPVVTNAGLVDGAPYGTRSLPEIGDWVMVAFAGRSHHQEVIVGTVIPYLTNEFTGDAVNSSSKQFTKKLVESGKEGSEARIFKSGTTVEVDSDGTIVVETPSGTYLRVDEANGVVEIVDQHGNDFNMGSGGVTIDDVNGNNVTMTTGKVTVNGNLEVLQ